MGGGCGRGRGATAAWQAGKASRLDVLFVPLLLLPLLPPLLLCGQQLCSSADGLLKGGGGVGKLHGGGQRATRAGARLSAAAAATSSVAGQGRPAGWLAGRQAETNTPRPALRPTATVCIRGISAHLRQQHAVDSARLCQLGPVFAALSLQRHHRGLHVLQLALQPLRLQLGGARLLHACGSRRVRWGGAGRRAGTCSSKAASGGERSRLRRARSTPSTDHTPASFPPPSPHLLRPHPLHAGAPQVLPQVGHLFKSVGEVRCHISAQAGAAGRRGSPPRHALRSLAGAPTQPAPARADPSHLPFAANPPAPPVPAGTGRWPKPPAGSREWRARRCGRHPLSQTRPPRHRPCKVRRMMGRHALAVAVAVAGDWTGAAQGLATRHGQGRPLAQPAWLVAPAASRGPAPVAHQLSTTSSRSSAKLTASTPLLPPCRATTLPPPSTRAYLYSVTEPGQQQGCSGQGEGRGI